MSTYQCEGYIKEVTIEDGNVMFKLEPAAPYAFERKKDEGSTERCLLFVDDDKNPCEAQVVTANKDFSAPTAADFHSLIIAKANRLKACVKAEIQSKANIRVVNRITFS